MIRSILRPADRSAVLAALTDRVRHWTGQSPAPGILDRWSTLPIRDLQSTLTHYQRLARRRERI